MKVSDFIFEYNYLKDERKQAGLDFLFNLFRSDTNKYDRFIQEILMHVDEEDQNDFFGTEGLKL